MTFKLWLETADPQALLAAVFNHIDDDTPYLVLADCLEERGWVHVPAFVRAAMAAGRAEKRVIRDEHPWPPIAAELEAGGVTDPPVGVSFEAGGVRYEVGVAGVLARPAGTWGPYRRVPTRRLPEGVVAAALVVLATHAKNARPGAVIGSARSVGAAASALTHLAWAGRDLLVAVAEGEAEARAAMLHVTAAAREAERALARFPQGLPGPGAGGDRGGDFARHVVGQKFAGVRAAAWQAAETYPALAAAYRAVSAALHRMLEKAYHPFRGAATPGSTAASTPRGTSPAPAGS